MIGQTISHYKIIEKLGEGGMGVVYKAQDLNLDRAVALKFLPPHVSSSSEDKARFVQEAKAAAALSHPNICTIHGVEEHDERTFIVMEYVEGKMLNDAKANMALRQAVEIGIQIADGLAAAHEKGVVHRDIKPENIMIRKDGIVQIMDFGLAKLRGATRLTKEGSTVGTAGYMSPEQIQGQETDHRTDIFSLGVILYEMFTGQSPFKGEHETAINYEIVNVDPEPMSSIKPDTGAELDRIVLECLLKELSERTQSAAEVAKDLRHYKRESSRTRMSRITSARQVYTQTAALPSEAPQRPQSMLQKYLPWIISAVSLLGLIAVLLLSPRSSSVESFPVRALIPPQENTNFHPYGFGAGPVVVSPNGRMIAFVAVTQDGKTMLYLRPLDGTTAKPLAGTEGASYPFWSPDSKWIAFFVGSTGKLKKVDIAGSPPVTICAGNGRGGTWGKDGMIILSPAPNGSLYTVSAAGGTPTPITRIDTSRNEYTHRWPYFLPDGEHFLYFSRTVSFGAEAEGDAVFVASLDFKTNKLLLNTSANAVYASGYLLFMRGSTLLAQQFDENSLELKGDAYTIAEGVINDAGFNLAVFSVSQNGVLAYQTGVGQAGARMMIVDRTGKELGLIGDVIENFDPRLSPDGQEVVVSLFEPKSRTQNLWLYDLTRNSRTRLTSGLSSDIRQVWSPDGSLIVYFSQRREVLGIYVRPSAVSGTEQVLYESKEPVRPTDWSRDGKYIALQKSFGSQNDILILPLSGDKKPFPYLQTQFNESQARFSPDGRWMAFESNESGQNEIYIRPFPGPGTSVKVSTTGGTAPVWNPGGRELYYISSDNKTMAAEIRSKASNIEIGVIHPLFTRTPVMSEYDIFPDGKRFLVNRVIEPKETGPITLVVNWDAELKKQ